MYTITKEQVAKIFIEWKLRSCPEEESDDPHGNKLFAKNQIEYGEAYAEYFIDLLREI